LKKYNEIILEIQDLKIPEVEKNIFSLGGRGHYENPISDILAFFIDPKEEHGFGSLILESLLEAAGKSEIRAELIAPPLREAYTDFGNRIDLLAEGEDWVLAIENKIRHVAINPFEDYEKHINLNYDKKNDKIFILLTINYASASENWIWVKYSNFINCIKKNIGSYSFLSCNNHKWYVILREFILNIQSEFGDSNMNNERINFIKDNYSDILEINIMHNEYIEHIKVKGLEVINSVSKNNDIAFSKQHNWESGIALRLISKDWDNQTNITLLLMKDGVLRLILYVYDITDERVDVLKKNIDQKKYSEYSVESRTIRCFGSFDSRNEDEIFSEIGLLAKRLNTFFSA